MAYGAWPMSIDTKENTSVRPDDGLRISTVRAFSLLGSSFTLDAKYYQEEFVLAKARVANCGYPSVPVLKLADAFVAKRTKLITVHTPGAGAPYLRAHDAFEVRLESDRYVSQIRTKDYESYLLKEGMLLTPSSGRNLGPLAYVGKKLSQFAMTDIIRVVPYSQEDAFYLLAFFLTNTGQALLRRGRTGTTVDHLSPDDVLNIPVVLLEPQIRQQIAASMRIAEALLDNARLTLDLLEKSLHDKAGLPTELPEGDCISSSATRAFGLQASKLALRLDTAFYDPRIEAARRRLQKSGAARLQTLADLRMIGRYKRYYVSSGFGRPILSGRQLLQLRPVNLKYISDRSFREPEEFILRRGWTVFTCDGRAEEALGSPAFIHSRWDGWMASNHIMRAIPNGQVHPGFLYLALRSPYVQVQLQARATGSVVDALDPATISDILLPVLAKEDMDNFGSTAQSAWEDVAQALDIEDATVKLLEEMIIGGYEGTELSSK
jgi:hypothetical protein